MINVIIGAKGSGKTKYMVDHVNMADKEEANKVSIPFEKTSALASLGAIKEVLKDDKK